MSSEVTPQGGRMNADRDGIASAQFVNPLTETSWDDMVAGFDQVGFFHSSAWARVLTETYGFRSNYLKRTELSGSRAIMPVMETSPWLFRRRAVSLPFTDECKALADKPASVCALFEDVLRQTAGKSWTSWEYRGGCASIPETPTSQSFFGHSLALKGNTDDLFARFDGTARTSVRKALQQGVSVEFASDLDALRIFHRQLCGTRQRHGLPPQPFRFFEAIHRHVLAAGLGVVAIARQGGAPVASAVFFHFKKTAIYKFAASDFSFRHLQANHLVLWRAIEHYAKQGFLRFDFGRTSRANPGLRHFKLAWRPEEYSIDYVKYDRCRARFVEGEKERTTGWHNRVFRILPLPVSRLIGAVAYRHMA